MTSELGILIGFTIFLSFLFCLSLWYVRESHRSTVESLRGDNKALHSLLKQAQDRIHASSITDYLALQGRDSPTHEPVRRNDAIEAEIASRVNGGGL